MYTSIPFACEKELCARNAREDSFALEKALRGKQPLDFSFAIGLK